MSFAPLFCTLFTGIRAVDTSSIDGKDAPTPTKTSTPSATAEGASRFELAPPRRFILPAILLLLVERPGYGYGLVPRLEGLGFGHVDRPAVYRALALLEQDGLITCIDQNSAAGQARRVYSVTGQGERVLRVWVGVVMEEHERLGHVVRRYQATGTADAVLAEVEGDWTNALGVGWSPISPISSGRRLIASVESDPAGVGTPGREDEPDGSEQRTSTGRFRLDPERSAVLIDVRSTVGPISFGTMGVHGTVEASVASGSVNTQVAPTGTITFDVRDLHSGNRLYDAELLRRIDARRFPTVTVELEGCECVGPGARYSLTGNVEFHGLRRHAEGSVKVNALSATRLAVTGEQTFDIRDYALPSPTVLMLRIYPDIRVRLHVEAELEEAR